MKPIQITPLSHNSNNYIDNTSASAVTSWTKCAAYEESVTASSTLLHNNIIMVIRKEDEQ